MGKKRDRFVFKKPDRQWQARSQIASPQTIDLLPLCQYLPPTQKKLLTFFLMFLIINQVSADLSPAIESYLRSTNLLGKKPIPYPQDDLTSALIASKVTPRAEPETRIAKYQNSTALSKYHLFSRADVIAANFNQDLNCPFTNIDFLDMPPSEHQHKKLNKENIGAVKIIDFWGEGRISDSGLISGFPDAYNVNYQAQKISNGIYKGRDIPNRIPTRSYDDVNISRFVEKDTFQYVTSMGAPITNATAKEMYRIIRKDDDARIIFYGDNDEYTQALQKASQNHFVYMQHTNHYRESLDPHLREININAPNIIVPINLVLKDLAKALDQLEFKTAAGILIDLQVYCDQGLSRTAVITSRVDKLLSKIEGVDLLDAVKALTDETEVIEKISQKFKSEPRAPASGHRR